MMLKKISFAITGINYFLPVYIHPITNQIRNLFNEIKINI